MKKCVIISIIVVAVVAIGVGIGLGVYFGTKSKDPSSNDDVDLQNAEKGDTIDILSDQSLIFTGIGDTAQIQAKTITGNPIIYKSSDENVVTVTKDGLVKAETNLVSSAVITLTSEGSEPIYVVASIVVLAPETVLIASDDVSYLDLDKGEAIIKRNNGSEAISVGSLSLSGDKGGLFHRVISVTEEDDASVKVELTLASLTDIVQELELNVSSPITTYVEDKVDFSSSLASLQKKTRRMLRGTDDDLCSFGTEGPKISIEGTDFKLINEIEANVDIDIKVLRFKVTKLDIIFNGRFGLDAYLGELAIETGTSSILQCSSDLPFPEMVKIPIFGPLFLSPTIGPSIGFDIEASLTGPSMNIKGPKFLKGISTQVGLKYDESNGLRPFKDIKEFGDGLTWPTFEAKMDTSFSLDIEPYINAELGISLIFVSKKLLAKIEALEELLDLGIAEARVSLGSELDIKEPIDFKQRGYSGPEWSVKFNRYIGLDPLKKEVKVFLDFLNIIGIKDVASRLDGLDPKLYNESSVLLKSPVPQLELERDQGSLILTVPQAEQGHTYKFIGFEEGENIGKDLGSFDGDGNLFLKESQLEAQTLEVRVLLFDDIFGYISLPYAGAEVIQVELSDPVLTPSGESDEPPNPDYEEENTVDIQENPDPTLPSSQESDEPPTPDYEEENTVESLAVLKATSFQGNCEGKWYYPCLEELQIEADVDGGYRMRSKQPAPANCPQALLELNEFLGFSGTFVPPLEGVSEFYMSVLISEFYPYVLSGPELECYALSYTVISGCFAGLCADDSQTENPINDLDDFELEYDWDEIVSDIFTDEKVEDIADTIIEGLYDFGDSVLEQLPNYLNP